MSRRLGDDPLTRARSERAKAAAVSASIMMGSEGQEGAAQTGTQPASRASYNDVFFQRREGHIAPQPAADASAAEAPEISEISQIPEIREAAASASATTFDSTIDSRTTSLEAQDPRDVSGPGVSTIEQVSAKPEGGDVSAASQAIDLPQTKEEPNPTITFHNPTTSNNGSNSEPPKSGGFFKRLFGKFK